MFPNSSPATVPPSPTLYEVALGMAQGIGGVLARTLLSYCGSAEAVFKASPSQLYKIPQIGEKAVQSLRDAQLMSRAEQELEACLRQGIHPLFLQSPLYPRRLKEIYDAPILLFYKGNIEALHQPRMLSIVGTRRYTEYGRNFLEQAVEQLSSSAPCIVSGLAYGIDIIAHRQALKQGLPTIAVMASGMDIIYPAVHRATAEEIIGTGGLLTESPLGTKPDAPRFPARNRIIAALADATLVVEAQEQGGAMITAQLANDYNREVFALPGNYYQSSSKGCNKLIKTHQAHLIESAVDVLYIMNWQQSTRSQQQQLALEVSLNEEERRIVQCLQSKKALHVDELALALQLSPSILSMHLLNLEMNKLIEALPGKKYKLSAR